MRFTSQAEQFFRGEALARGSFCAREGLVDIQVSGPTFLLASVADEDDEDHQVAVDSSDAPRISTLCTCPEFTGGALCGHIWATLLSAEAQGMAPVRAGSRALEIVRSPESLGLEGDDLLDEIALEDGLRRPGGPRHGGPRSPGDPLSPPPRPPWRVKLQGLSGSEPATPPWARTSREAIRQLWYVLDLARPSRTPSLWLKILVRKLGKGGAWSAPASVNLDREQIECLSDAKDQAIFSMILACGHSTYGHGHGHGHGYGHDYRRPSGGASILIPTKVLPALLPLLCATGRFFLSEPRQEEAAQALSLDEGPAWQLRVSLSRDEAKQAWTVQGRLERDGESMDLGAPALMLKPGYFFHGSLVSCLDDGGAFEWIELLRSGEPLEVPFVDVDAFLAEALARPCLPPLELPGELGLEEVRVAPIPCLTIRPGRKSSALDGRLLAEPAFLYEDVEVGAHLRSTHLPHLERSRLLWRDLEAESAAMAVLMEAGLKLLPSRLRRDVASEGVLEVKPRHLPRVVSELSARGWRVEAEGKLYRPPGEIRIEVKSGIDWFDVHAEVDFGGQLASLPALLKAARRGEKMVLLDDGTYGMLPEAWLERHGMLLGAGEAGESGESGEAAGEKVRFRKCHVGFLDVLLAAQPAAAVDATFEAARAELRAFDGIEPLDPPRGFQGKLRPYQRDGLGWFAYLRRFGFGGILADDMGLGKTVQVLALLEARRKDPEVQRPSLAVVPKSLVFNWKSEARKFAPRLRVLDHTGQERSRSQDRLEGFDLVLTTYGTLRRDIDLLAKVSFDYVILDEAQAVKNASTASARAVRLLQGSHRLVMSGTPIENHLGELWSLLEFLNPGMLGAASAFQKFSRGAGKCSPEALQVLQRALRPFILRRTKAQVVQDLPEKNEQTIYCQLEPEERRLYDELRDHYRASLLKKVAAEGLGKAKLNVLEALLRLRQAACHTGLVDKGRLAEPSAKLDLLLEMLEEVREEGHKALVFSQFTSLLSIVRARLDAMDVRYEYLDGRTTAKKREEAVRRFQEEPDSRLFLVSLKAGGLGLNLTAAEYVFLLDPWWNPAIETQAIDRAHRIGQQNKVFAYRLVAKGTVEEKVLELQQSKRALADAIIGAEGTLLGDLSREDLELLLS